MGSRDDEGMIFVTDATDFLAALAVVFFTLIIVPPTELADFRATLVVLSFTFVIVLHDDAAMHNTVIVISDVLDEKRIDLDVSNENYFAHCKM